MYYPRRTKITLASDNLFCRGLSGPACTVPGHSQGRGLEISSHRSEEGGGCSQEEKLFGTHGLSGVSATVET